MAGAPEAPDAGRAAPALQEAQLAGLSTSGCMFGEIAGDVAGGVVGASTYKKIIGARGFDKHAKDFDKWVADLSKARGTIPKRVVHDRPCRGMCATRSEISCWECFQLLSAEVCSQSFYLHWSPKAYQHIR